MTYNNIEKFEAWVKETVKDYYENIEVYLEELEDDYSVTGTPCYEIGSTFTKSHRPECYSYEVEDLFDGEEFVDRVITF